MITPYLINTVYQHRHFQFASNGSGITHATSCLLGGTPKTPRMRGARPLIPPCWAVCCSCGAACLKNKYHYKTCLTLPILITFKEEVLGSKVGLMALTSTKNFYSSTIHTPFFLEPSRFSNPLSCKTVISR